MMQQQTGAPTMIQYTEFDKAYDYLNGALFGGDLPKVLVTFSRKPRMLGYYSPDRWERTNNPEDLAGEISFNPDTFESRTADDNNAIDACSRNGTRLAVTTSVTPAERDTTTSSGEPRWNP